MIQDYQNKNIPMPMATAKWLVFNTSLTFQQIAEFANLHISMVQRLADEDTSYIPVSPIVNGILTKEEIQRCEKDVNSYLISSIEDKIIKKQKKYVPKVSRKDIPGMILWLLKHYPKITDVKIIQILRTTNIMIKSIREKTRPDYEDLVAISPIDNIITAHELEDIINS